MNLRDAFDAAAYAAADDASAESKMPNAPRHLVGANVVLMLLMMIATMLIVVMMLLILRLGSYYNVFAIKHVFITILTCKYNLDVRAYSNPKIHVRKQSEIYPDAVS
jgi:hypothetical protein